MQTSEGVAVWFLSIAKKALPQMAAMSAGAGSLSPQLMTLFMPFSRRASTADKRGRLFVGTNPPLSLKPFPRRHASCFPASMPLLRVIAANLAARDSTLSIRDDRVKVHGVNVEPVEESSELLGRDMCSFSCRHVSVMNIASAGVLAIHTVEDAAAKAPPLRAG